MSVPCTLPDSNERLCGCCEGFIRETPQTITNRAALTAITYRAGAYATFYASMLASLSNPDFPALAALRTHASSDFSIALLDAWAVILDILTFYQERLANEAFLRTAVDQRSVFELARLVGYVPSPGVSASATLAFTLSDAPGSPDHVLIPAGTRVQSVPGPGQKPQMFETSSDLTAVIALNAMAAQTHIFWQIDKDDTFTWISGIANNISVGDALLFLAAPSGHPSTTGPADFRYVSRIKVDAGSGNTQVWWNQPLTNVTSSATADIAIYIFRKKAALFGAQAPNPFLLPTDTLKQIPGNPLSTSRNGEIGGISLTSRITVALPIMSAPISVRMTPTDWIYSYEGGGVIHLDASYTGLAPAGVSPSGTPDQLQWIVLTGPDSTALFQIAASSESNPNRYTVSAKTSQLTLSTAAVLAGSLGTSLDAILNTLVGQTRTTTAYIQSELLTPASVPLTNWQAPTVFPLTVGMIVPVQGGSLTVVGGQQIASGQPIGISGKRVRLQAIVGNDTIFVPSNTAGILPVADSQIFYADAFPPTLDAITGLPSWRVTTLSGISGTLIVAAGNMQLLPADKNDPIVSEASMVSVASVMGDVTTLTLKSILSGIYDAVTVRVNANAVGATNGETVHEILGSGAPNKALQFTLKQSPLTYISAATGNGTQSTLEVWVNNLQWHEVSNLIAAGPADRVFTTRIDPQGGRIVQFGNGTEGACTPTGQSNIRAVYRKGIGSPGMVDARQLSQLIDRQQGVKSVVNPSAASGAADPASAADARLSAPLPTLTVGRIVSLEDYQNFAINFAGIAKALATWTWFGNRRGISLSIAGEKGAILTNDDPIVIKLVAAVQSSSNRYIPLKVAPYVPVLFRIAAAVRVDQENYDPGLVRAQVWQNIQNTFAFDRRQLAQNVVGSQIVEIIQQTPGVIATQLQALNLSGDPATGPVPAMLCAAGPTPPQGAQMLLLDSSSENAIGGWS